MAAISTTLAQGVKRLIMRLGRKSAPTLDHLVQRYLDAHTRLVSHRKYAARYGAHIQPALGGKAAAAVTRGDLLQLYLDKRREVVRRGVRTRVVGRKSAGAA